MEQKQKTKTLIVEVDGKKYEIETEIHHKNKTINYKDKCNINSIILVKWL